MVVEIVNQNVFVGLPTASCNHHLPASGEAFHQRQGTGCAANVDDTVEAGVSHDADRRHSDFGKEFARRFVLDVEVCQVLKHSGIGATVGAEEDLVGAEDGGDTVTGDAAPMQHVDVVAPKLIFDEICLADVCSFDEATRVARGVKRQIANDVGAFIVLAHLVA